MKNIQNFKDYAISRTEQRFILGGLGDASANCLDGTSVSCSGSSCVAFDEKPGKEGGCACSTGNTMDIKPCPKMHEF